MENRFASPGDPEVLTLTQTAKLLRLSEERVKAEVDAGRLAGRRIGRSWRFSRTAVLTWLGTTGGDAPR
ncbi:helix-turn-helix domain-containing protein [Kineosporia sp. A_224]|uniref:helix-turn-helix domain-containing protein n=1 Tax=Kineosporia sp. A_224 TaxID=1962180 RepID=UPI00130416B5|nr:helix-turn-helix domain-containing protein [Kineosporia sp. A_224]